MNESSNEIIRQVLEILARAGRGQNDFANAHLDFPAALRPVVDEVRSLVASLRGNAESPKEQIVDDRIERGRQLENLLNNLPNLIGYWDKTCLNIHANKEYTKVFGKSPESIRGKHMREVLGEKLFEKNRPYIEAALRGEQQTFEREIPSVDGLTSIHTLARYIPDIVAGEVVGFSVIVTDVSELHEREHRLNAIIEQMSDGIAICDERGTVMHCNPASLQILGMTEDQFKGRIARDMNWRPIREDGSPLPPGELPSEKLLRTGEGTKNFRSGVHLPNGEIRWLRSNVIPLKKVGQAAGAMQGSVLITFSDVTDLTNEEFRIKSQLQSLLTNNQDVYFVADRDGNFSCVNTVFATTLGLNESEIHGKGILNFVHPDDRDHTKAVLDKIGDGFPAGSVENRIVTSSGVIRTIAWHFQLNLKTREVSGFGRDVTDLRRKESDFRQLIGALEATAIVAQTDASGKIVDVNDNFIKITGYSREELIGIDHRILNSGVHDKQFFRNMWKTISSGRSWSGDICNRRKNGELYWVRTVVTPLFDPLGKIEKYIAMRFDVTAQKVAEREREQLREDAIEKSKRMAVVIDNFPGDVARCDRDFRYTFVNSDHSGRELISEMIGKTIAEVRGQEVFRAAEAKFVAGLRGISSWFEWTAVLPNGVTRYWRGKIRPDFDGRGNVTGLFIFEIDITNQRQAQAQLVQSARMASLGEMAAGIAHEINNPLAIVVGKARSVHRRISGSAALRQDLVQDTQVIVDSGQRIAKIVKGLAAFSRSGEQDPFEMIELSKLIDDVLGLCLERFKRHDINLTIYMDDDRVMECRRTQVSQILLNLLNNAFDAVQPCSERWVRVTVACPDLDHVEFSVADSGPGIARDLREKIMEPFFTTKPVGKGIGLGLSISRGIAEDHGGTLVLSDDFTQTQFILRLPRLQSTESRKVAV